MADSNDKTQGWTAERGVYAILAVAGAAWALRAAVLLTTGTSENRGVEMIEGFGGLGLLVWAIGMGRNLLPSLAGVLMLSGALLWGGSLLSEEAEIGRGLSIAAATRDGELKVARDQAEKAKAELDTVKKELDTLRAQAAAQAVTAPDPNAPTEPANPPQ